MVLIDSVQVADAVQARVVKPGSHSTATGGRTGIGMDTKAFQQNHLSFSSLLIRNEGIHFINQVTRPQLPCGSC